METHKVAHFSSELSQDSALHAAITAHTPVWPRWERLSDVQALLSVEASNVAPEATCAVCGAAPVRVAATSECLSCYAHAVSHGKVYDYMREVVDFVESVAGKLTTAEKRAVESIARKYGYGRQ